MKDLNELIELLTLTEIEENIFQGNSYNTPWGRVFGGQVLGQSLHAAYRTVPEDRIAHSMHAYFILGGDCSHPITYKVDTIREGRSFTTRRVAAIQNEKNIFVMAASFQKRQSGFDHQITMPNVLPPKVLLNDVEQLAGLEKKDPALFKQMRGIHPNAIEFRPVEHPDPLNPKPSNPFRHVWFKAKEAVPNDLRLQHQILAYASDYSLLLTALNPHRAEIDRSKLFIASLDHAIWFHRDFKMDDWLLYALDSPSASNSRGFCRGSIFDQDGRLVASVTQEGLLSQERSS